MEAGNYFEDNESKSSKKLTPERVVSILEKHGTKVSVEEAGIILQFMRKVAYVAVNQYLSVKKD
ncbi:hypothetical protein H3Z85_18035 [Chryseobacterium indologenes]|uniref:hypothetical protein n=1 Tax=Chryseobacterium indologenes TaxID=253 RepID=UPI0003E06F1C|nr:hypothetical protein [Chryseobacterium indologenes]QPQ51209.1 hypothetical protein H3Z85_18035 [Chryseobacterium indologenes]GAE66755.1 hypothetical protein CIN01S_18_00820 [Chryseobacterium indologenes NBRC 14944]SFK00747.1 hypothetical protein SAMN05421692_3105 [Chryseobacterium indologenes]SUX49595.1 Uncharacterised protein [Chryseobacterium indologenes]